MIQAKYFYLNQSFTEYSGVGSLLLPHEDLQDHLELTLKKDVLFIIGDQNVRVGIQEIPAVTGKFDLGVQNEAGQRLTAVCQENVLARANKLFQQHTRDKSTHGHNQMVNTKIRLR